MFLAHASALRSSSLGRQVGAAVLDTSRSLLAVGTNEVPRAGGGQYWPDDKPGDGRDFNHGDRSDSTIVMRRALIKETLDLLREFGLIDQGADLNLAQLMPVLRNARINKLIEFGRPVHAEMAAITDAARRGVALGGGRIFTTTYPCHSCARHIVAAGLSEVVYIEPYAKSLAQNLHEDSIARDWSVERKDRVQFRQFIGVAPRRYEEFFARSKEERRDSQGVARLFDAESASPLNVSFDPFYQLSEFTAVAALGHQLASLELLPGGDTFLRQADYDN